MYIPSDLKKYLNTPCGRHMKFRFGEIQEVELFSLEELVLKTFDVQTDHYRLNGEYLEDSNQVYEYRGLDLVKSCNSYSPEGILIWFIDLFSYGAWDYDHHTIMLFPEISWTEILEEPEIYFNAHWYPKNVDHVYVKPWEYSNY